MDSVWLSLHQYIYDLCLFYILVRLSALANSLYGEHRRDASVVACSRIARPTHRKISVRRHREIEGRGYGNVVRLRGTGVGRD